MAIRTLIAKFLADTTQFEAGVKRAEKALTPFQQKLATIKELGKTLSIFRGAGAIAGVTLAARQLSLTLEAAADSAVQLRAGLGTVDDVISSIAKSIPVIATLDRTLLSLDRIFGVTGEMESRKLQLDALDARKQAELAIAKERRDWGKAQFDRLVKLGREQADERARDAFDLGAANMQRLIEMGREQLGEVRSNAEAIVAKFRDPLITLQEQIDAVTDAWRRGFIEAGDYMHTVVMLGKEMDKIRDSQQAVANVVSRPSGDFRQISLSRTAIGGLSATRATQTVVSPQLAETNRLLAIIERNQGRSGSATFGP